MPTSPDRKDGLSRRSALKGLAAATVGAGIAVVLGDSGTKDAQAALQKPPYSPGPTRIVFNSPPTEKLPMILKKEERSIYRETGFPPIVSEAGDSALVQFHFRALRFMKETQPGYFEKVIRRIKQVRIVHLGSGIYTDRGEFQVGLSSTGSLSSLRDELWLASIYVHDAVHQKQADENRSSSISSEEIEMEALEAQFSFLMAYRKEPFLAGKELQNAVTSLTNYLAPFLYPGSYPGGKEINQKKYWEWPRDW